MKSDTRSGALLGSHNAPGTRAGLSARAEDAAAGAQERIRTLIADQSAAEATGLGFFAATPHAARPSLAHRLSIWFHDSQPSRPVRINHTLARPSEPVAAMVRPQARRPQSPQALRSSARSATL